MFNQKTSCRCRFLFNHYWGKTAGYSRTFPRHTQACEFTVLCRPTSLFQCSIPYQRCEAETLCAWLLGSTWGEIPIPTHQDKRHGAWLLTIQNCAMAVLWFPSSFPFSVVPQHPPLSLHSRFLSPNRLNRFLQTEDIIVLTFNPPMLSILVYTHIAVPSSFSQRESEREAVGDIAGVSPAFSQHHSKEGSGKSCMCLYIFKPHCIAGYCQWSFTERKDSGETCDRFLAVTFSPSTHPKEYN